MGLGRTLLGINPGAVDDWVEVYGASLVEMRWGGSCRKEGRKEALKGLVRCYAAGATALYADDEDIKLVQVPEAGNPARSLVIVM